MKILVLSDSHSGISFMRRCVLAVKPDGVVHLGDYYEDGSVLASENPGIPFYQVPGNCDRGRILSPEVLCISICGVRLYMTHGHLHQVKYDLGALLAQARASQADAVLYGHTHSADCHREADGLWVLNPGSCGSWGGSCGMIEIEKGKITACRILRQADLEGRL